MRIEEVIGKRIRSRREALNMTQEELGREVGELLKREWPRQAVSAAERGGRAFTAAELGAIAIALGTAVTNLFFPAEDVSEVELSPGAIISRTAAAAAAVHARSPEWAFDSMLETIASMTARIQLSQDATGLLAKDVKMLSELLVNAASIQALRTGTDAQ